MSLELAIIKLAEAIEKLAGSTALTQPVEAEQKQAKRAAKVAVKVEEPVEAEPIVAAEVTVAPITVEKLIEVKPTPKAEEPKVEYAEVQKRIIELATKSSREHAVNFLMSEFGVSKGQEIPVAKYADAVRLLDSEINNLQLA